MFSLACAQACLEETPPLKLGCSIQTRPGGFQRIIVASRGFGLQSINWNDPLAVQEAMAKAGGPRISPRVAGSKDKADTVKERLTSNDPEQVIGQKETWNFTSADADLTNNTDLLFWGFLYQNMNALEYAVIDFNNDLWFLGSGTFEASLTFDVAAKTSTKKTSGSLFFETLPRFIVPIKTTPFWEQIGIQMQDVTRDEGGTTAPTFAPMVAPASAPHGTAANLSAGPQTLVAGSLTTFSWSLVLNPEVKAFTMVPACGDQTDTTPTFQIAYDGSLTAGSHVITFFLISTDTVTGKSYVSEETMTIVLT